MRLQAISAGEHAPRGRFNGAVHSLFRRACNVRLDDGRLLALLAPELANLPHGIRVETASHFTFEEHVRIGQSAGCRADVLRLGRDGLLVALGSARPWRSDLTWLGADLDVPGADLAWRTAWDAFWRHERGASPCDPVRSAIFRDGLFLTSAARALQAEEAGAVVDRLIGRGPGLTPAGDDLIAGFLAGLWVATGDRPERLAFLRSLGETVVRAAAATTEISRAFLRHAAAGSVAEPLALLARCLGEGAAPNQVEQAAARALAIGHTSGADATFGLLLGLAAWRPAWFLPEQIATIEAIG